jgi:integrase/recombinase XerD
MSVSLEDYLQVELAPATASRYQREIERYCQLAEDPLTAGYNEIMDYLGYIRKRNLKGGMICVLYGIKKYYSYLLKTGQRKDNPAATIRLRDTRNCDVQLQDLFTAEELERLLECKVRNRLLVNRNKIILSLLIYQGLTMGELCRLECDNINLEEGTVYIKPTRRTNSRTLKLQAKQVFWIMNYLQADRPKFTKKEISQLLITQRGRAESGDGIKKLLQSYKHLYPGRKLNAQTIRQSVITNLLKKGTDLRVVQTFAGHKYPSATEKYKQSDVEALKNEVLKYHPLK